MMNNDQRSLTALLQRSTLTAERQTVLVKFFPKWLTSSTYQPRVTAISNDIGADLSGFTDAEVAERLAEIKSVNWLRTGVRLRAIKKNSCLGKCRDAVDSLLTAVSTVLWGHLDVIDDHVIACLRQVLVYLLSNSNQDSELARRWKLHNDIIAANVDLDLDKTAQLIDVCHGDLVNLHAIHICALSQIICRPIIVILDNRRTAADDGRLSGIYLPMMQPLSSCCRYPVVVSLSSETDGFLPLVTTRPISPADREMVVPLCSSDLEPLEVRCLLETERPDSLLETYLRVTEVPCTRADGITLVPAARLDGQTAASFDELWDNLRANDDTPAKDDLPHCSSQGCRHYGLVEYSGKCLQCYKNKSATSEPLQARRLVPAEDQCQFIADEEGRQKHDENEYVALVEDTKRCTNPLCEEPASPYYDGFCAACYIDPNRCRAPRVSLQPTHVPAVTSRWNADEHNDVQRIHSNVQTSSGRRVTFAQEAVPVRVRNGKSEGEHQQANSPCMSEGCPSNSRRGSILCADCERQQRLELERLEESQRRDPHLHQLEPQSGQPQQLLVPRRQQRSVYCTGPTPVIAPGHRQVDPGQWHAHLPNHAVSAVARRCVSGHCDRYGDANYDGFCSVCYIRYRR